MSKIRRGIHYYSTFFPLDSPTRRLVFFDNPPIYLWCNNGTMRSNIQPSIRREGKGNKPSKYHGIRVQRLHRDKANFDRLKMLCYDHKQNLPGSCKKKHTHTMYVQYIEPEQCNHSIIRGTLSAGLCAFFALHFWARPEKSLNIVLLNHLLFQHQRMLATIFKDISHALISSTINHITHIKIIFEMKLGTYVKE